MSAAILFCSDPLGPRRVDAQYAAEAELVRDAGAQTALIDHDALLAGDVRAAVRRVPADLGPAWYRGWMIPSGAYAALAAALDARGVTLLTGAEDYRRAHELPGWYATFAAVTPASVWSEGTPSDIAGLVAPLPPGAGIVKDYVKSRKHEWLEACFLPDVRDVAAVEAVVATFVERQAESLAGGVVVRAFEEFDAGGEARVWWLDGAAVLVTPHPDTPELRPEPDLDAVTPLVAALGCRFVTTDLARRTDGTWRVIEVGDAQVSGIASADQFGALLPALLGAQTRR